MAEGGRLPIDVDALKTVFYKVGTDGIPDPNSIQACTGVISAMLLEAKKGVLKDSPIYQLLDYYPQPQLDHEKADIFRDQVKYSREVKEKLADARNKKVGPIEALKDVEQELGEYLLKPAELRDTRSEGKVSSTASTIENQHQLEQLGGIGNPPKIGLCAQF
jgi:hypothetical protein